MRTLVCFENSNDLGCLIYTLPFIGLSIWAFLNDRFVWIIIGVTITFIIILQIYDSYLDSKYFNNWIDANSGTIIFFYATTRAKQNLIKEKIGDEINSNIKKMYYVKSKIEGDIKHEQFIKTALGQLNKMQPKHPRLLQISGNTLTELLDLQELNAIENLEKFRLREIILKINSYA